LGTDERRDLGGDQFARREKASGMAERTQLQREPELVVWPAPFANMTQVIVTESLMFEQFGPAGWQAQKSLHPPASHGEPARHLCSLISFR
jgi:hypothetical protein